MPEEDSELRRISPEAHHRKAALRAPEFNLTNILILILILAVAVLGAYTYKPDFFKSVVAGKTGKQEAKNEQKNQGKPSDYSAVFLTNNQVYFGKLENVNSDFPVLKDVYYLRVQRPLQPPPATESAQPDVSLVKLGGELHGPIDEIKFNKDQILFVEELKTDGRVVQAIEEYKKRNP